MKSLYCLLALMLFAGGSLFAQRNYSTLRLDSVSVLAYFSFLRDSNGHHSPMQKIHVFGRRDTGWITKDDIAYLMPHIRSMKKTGCMVGMFSSYIPPVHEYSTLGGVAMDLIDAYRNQTAYPPRQWSCTKTNRTRAEETEAWWRNTITPLPSAK